MVRRVNLDAMIPRADFATTGDDYTLELFQNFPMGNLERQSPIRQMLRKPDFQRETNHWSPDQIITFLLSFTDNELIPSIILWKSPSHIFVIDGGHRLSTLRAWMEDDYGDGPMSLAFSSGEISDEQKRIAKRTRNLIETRIGRYSELKTALEVNKFKSPEHERRTRNLFTRALNLQWVQGSAEKAETSFFKINSQGTPLDDTEEMLLKNRRKSVAIGARAVLRAGSGHKYWSAFSIENQKNIESHSKNLFEIMFEPEVKTPVKTLDLPIAGSVSPVDALSILIEMIAICDRAVTPTPGTAPSYDTLPDDPDGTMTINSLKRTLVVLSRICGNRGGSLGLHPAVYFYNDKGKHSRFLFLGMVSLVSNKLRNNDPVFFSNFTSAREKLEKFLIDNKSIIGMMLQNMGKNARVNNIEKLFNFLIKRFSSGDNVTIEQAIHEIGGQGRILEITSTRTNQDIHDDVKSAVMIKTALQTAIKCPICKGLVDPAKSVSYDHVVPVRDGGTGDKGNVQLTHPYCNQSVKQ